MGWESSDVFRSDLGPLSRSNDGSLALVSCLFGGYKFASVLMRRSNSDMCLNIDYFQRRKIFSDAWN